MSSAGILNPDFPEFPEIAEIAEIASQIVDGLAALAPKTPQSEIDNGQRPPRIILDLPHSFWDNDSLVTRICELLRASVPGIYQSVELDCSLATSEQLSTATRLRKQGTANIVVTHCDRVDHQSFRFDELKPIAYSISPEIIAQLNSWEQKTAEIRATIDIARVLGILPIAVGLADGARARHLRELGCELGVYANSETATAPSPDLADAS